MASRRDPGLILVSIILAALLAIVPIPEGVISLRPYWMALVLIYWRLESPDQVGLGTAFGAGLLLDLVTGTLLGHHALSLVIIVYIVGRFRLRIRFFPLWQQAFAVLAVLVNDRLIHLWILALSGQGLPGWRVLWPPLVAMLLWPWIFLALDETRRRRRAR